MRGPGLGRLINQISRAFGSKTNSTNKFNEAFLFGGEYTPYDTSAKSYIEQGYNINPLVFSMITQMSNKTASVPFYIKEIEDKNAQRKLTQLMDSTKGNLSMTQRLKFTKLITKAYSKEDKPFPMERPNVNQTWTEWIALYKTFIKTTGNVYIYCLAPEDGVNKGKPVQVYLLPSHLMQIVVKDNVDFLTSENPVKEYILTEGASYIEFDAEKVIHIKYSNPNYDENGAHLYGMSPLRAALKNIQNSNTGLDLNIKTLKSGGAFGLIHAKSTPLTEDQAKSIKDRLLEMDSSPDRLSKIAGVSAEVGFTRLSLTSDELKPFDYLAFDRQQIADCLIWELVDGNRGDFGGTIEQLRKQRVTDNIQPDLKLLTQALNEQFLPRFKGYENAEIIFDIMELPEMQTDVKELTEWLNTALDRGVINRNEYRNAIHYLEVDEEDMTRFTVTNDIISLEEALDNDFNIADQPAKQRRVKAGFDPNQPRAADGRWGSVTGGESEDEPNTDYRGSHQISYDPEYNTTLDDLTKGGQLIPEDIFEHPEWYANMSDPAYRESWAAILKVQGKPNAMIEIFRGVPKGVTNINSGDWISLSRIYATQHSYDMHGDGKDGDVISMMVRVGDISWDGNDINEFSYFKDLEK